MKKINMGIFNFNKKTDIVDNLLDIEHNEELSQKITILQNEISVSFDTRIIAVTSINKDKLAAAFAKALADTYVQNGSSALIIDGNLYNPVMSEIISGNTIDNKYNTPFSSNHPQKGTKIIYLSKNTYPAEAYKSGMIHKIIEENKTSYDHFIILVPSIKEHKEVILLSDIVNSIILVTQKNVTRREDIHNAIQYCYDNKLPLAKTVILK